MKLIFILFACICLQKPDPVQKGKKTAPAKKESKSSFNKLAPSILIINY